jgi:phosphoribosylformylglycinamidine synthase
VFLRAETKASLWTAGVERVLRIPIAHGEGRYECDDETLKHLEGDGLIAFRYVDAHGDLTPQSNANGSRSAIAGVLNPGRNVLGLMPHPERACRADLGSIDGREILKALALVNA